jgi:hypothetical protein
MPSWVCLILVASSPEHHKGMVCVQAVHQEHSLPRIQPNVVELCTMDASAQNLRIHPGVGGDDELLDLRTMLMR